MSTVAGGGTATSEQRDDADSDGLPLSARTRTGIGLALFAALVYLPILAMQPGKVDADTKSYLYLDPSRFLQRAASIWDPSIGFGTLSHQTVGYLFPMGPFYWFFEDVIGLPAWITQRIWLGTIILLAGLGVRYLLRALNVSGPGVPIAMLAYAFSPYVLGYSAIYSVMLSPWAALPWWIAFVALGMRRGGWKYPALFALTVQLAGALNGSALLFSLIGPALYIPYSVLVLREATWRRAWSLIWRVGILSFLTSLWWFIPLAIEGKYGMNVLRFTESIEVVSTTSLPFEVLRGLGNWYFYGKDRVGLWADARVDFTQRSLFIFVSLLIPTLTLLAAGLMRWKQRAYFILLALVGVAIAVGAEPYTNPSLLGGLYKSWALTSNFGFALRNTSRAAPLVILSFAVLLGVGVTELMRFLQSRQRQTWGLVIVGAVGALCLLNAVPALYGKYYSRSLERDEQVPGYWKRAIADLDAKPNDTRVLDLPGSDFASYRWGDTRDPIEPGLMDRPFVARELVPWGSAPSANLLQALDRRVQDDEAEPAALAPVARLMGVGDVVLRNDLQTDRWGLLPAQRLWETFGEDGTPGFNAPQLFGKKIPGRLAFPAIGDLTQPASAAPSPPPVAIMAVKDPLPIVRTKSADSPMVVDGDGEGVMDVAGAGLLDANRLLFYAAPYEKDPKVLRDLPPDSALVITDSNRRRGMRWSGLSANYGYTEQAGETALRDDPSDQRLEAFSETTDSARTVAVLGGIKTIRATRYGGAFGFQPRNRPATAFDGDLDTSWVVDQGAQVGHHELQVTLDEPITTDHLDLVQYFKDPDSQRPLHRFITRVGVKLGNGPVLTRRLAGASRTDAGQVLHFPRQTFSKLTLSFDGVPEGRSRAATVRNPVGFTEVRVTDDAPGSTPLRVTETMRMPRTLLNALGAKSAKHPLAIVMTRENTMDQSTLNREFDLPTARAFSLTGTALLGSQADDTAIDQSFGLPDADAGGVTATSSSRLAGKARASSALDGDPTTAWQSDVEKPRSEIHVTVPQATTLDHLDLQAVADGRHSIPTRLEITSDDGATRVVNLPVIPIRTSSGLTTVPVTFEPLSGRGFTIAITQVRPMLRSALLMPVGIAELGIPGAVRAPMPAQVPGTCLPSLVTIDGHPFPVRIPGSTADALSNRPLTIAPCDPGATVDLGSGRHTVRVNQSPKNLTGFDVKRLVLASGSGGTAVPVSTIAATTGTGRATPHMRIVSQGRTSIKVRVDATDKPFWLVLGESNNAGWSASAGGRDLGAPQLVDGYANGWRVDPARGGGPMTVTVSWAPQRTATLALWISAIAALACIGIVIGAWVRRRRRVGSPEAEIALPAPSVAVAQEDLAPGIAGLTTRATAWTVAAVTIGSALLVRPWVGLLVGALAFLAIRRPRWRLVLRLAPAVIVAGIAVYMAAGQYLEDYPARFDWPTFYTAARTPAWIAVVLLAADGLIEAVRRATRAQPGTRPPNDAQLLESRADAAADSHESLEEVPQPGPGTG